MRAIGRRLLLRVPRQLLWVRTVVLAQGLAQRPDAHTHAQTLLSAEGQPRGTGPVWAAQPQSSWELHTRPPPARRLLDTSRSRAMPAQALELLTRGISSGRGHSICPPCATERDRGRHCVVLGGMTTHARSSGTARPGGCTGAGAGAGRTARARDGAHRARAACAIRGEIHLHTPSPHPPPPPPAAASCASETEPTNVESFTTQIRRNFAFFVT